MGVATIWCCCVCVVPHLSATAVQVLVSIQSLILVPEPYFNEVSVLQDRQRTQLYAQ